jgi:hypothetical protein
VKTKQRTGTVRSRLSLVAGVLLTGCDEDNMAGLPFFTSGAQQAAEERDAARTVEKIEAREAEGGTVMQYEEGEDPLVGTWTYPEIWVSYPADSKGNRVGEGTWAERQPPQKFTILKQGEGWAMKTGAAGTSKVTFDGTRVTVEYSYPTNSARHTGILKGDTITGTQHLVAGPDVYDGPWTATRVK